MTAFVPTKLSFNKGIFTLKIEYSLGSRVCAFTGLYEIRTKKAEYIFIAY